MNVISAMADVITCATIQLAPLSVTVLMDIFWIQMVSIALVGEEAIRKESYIWFSGQYGEILHECVQVFSLSRRRGKILHTSAMSHHIPTKPGNEIFIMYFVLSAQSKPRPLSQMSTGPKLAV